MERADQGYRDTLGALHLRVATEVVPTVTVVGEASRRTIMDTEQREPRCEVGEDVCCKQRVWTTPTVQELPRLTDLTLQTGSPIPGYGNPGDGTTVF